MKYRNGRVTCNSGYIIDTSKEQLPDGTYITIKTKWYAFADMNTGVEGYFQFIDTGNYAPAKTQTTPEGYLQALKDCGYATSKNYVQNNMKVIETYNLRQYDGGTSMGYHVDPNRKPDSPLALKAMWTDNCTFPRKTKKKPNEFSLIPHCIAGNPSAEAQAAAFQQKGRDASATYIIDSKGVIIQGVPEDCRPWTTGGDLNVNGLTGSQMDHESITFEIANVTREPDWCMSAEAINSLVFLMVDICKRNGIPALKWTGNKFDAGTPKANVAAHRWFARKSCPGNFLYNSMGAVCDTVNFYLASAMPAPMPTPSNAGYYINGLDYSPVFDPATYRASRPDIVTSPYYGASDDAAWRHFCDFGMKEFIENDALANSKTSPEFCPRIYKERYSDLRESFGDDFYEYYKHYIVFGKNENRTAV